MFQWVLYTIWGLLPLFFFLLALWSKLEQVGGKNRQDHPGDFVKQGFFVLGCVVVAVLVDQFALKAFFEMLDIPGVPFPFFQVILLPLILWIAAKVIGPTTDIRISKPPTPSKKRR